MNACRGSKKHVDWITAMYIQDGQNTLDGGGDLAVSRENPYSSMQFFEQAASRHFLGFLFTVGAPRMDSN